MKIEIKKPNPEDLNAILRLWNEQYNYHYDLDPQYYVLNPLALSREYLNKLLANDEPHILIAVVNNSVIGFITFEIGNEEYLDTNIKTYGNVIELFVDKEYRRKGVGELLMENAEEYFKSKGIKWVKLQISSFNKDATHFYEELDYKNRQQLFFKEL